MIKNACYKANKILVGKTFLILFVFTMLLINIYSIVNPITLIPVRFRPQNIGIYPNDILVPTKMFTVLDVVVLGLIVLLIIYSLGSDFDHEMDDLTLIISGERYNKYLIGKILMILKIYIPMYFITYLNMYFLIKRNITPGTKILSLSKCLYISFTSQLFVISLTIFMIFFIRNVRGILIGLGGYFVVVEFILGHNLFRGMGLYSHFFIYNEAIINNILNNKFIYIILGIILIFIAIRLSGKERRKLIYN